MELPNANYLYTLALIAIGYVGFTAIVLILRQSLGGTLSSLDALVARLFMVRGFAVAYLSMAPMLVASFELSHTTVWRVSSALGGVSLVAVHLGYQVLRRWITGEPTPLHLWYYTVSGFALGILLLVNASAIAPTAIAGIYVTIVTLDMLQASVAFVHHSGYMIQEMQAQRKNVD